MAKVAHPRGVQENNKINRLRRLTGTLSLTGNRGEQGAMANRPPAPPGDKMKAPASAGTEARASLSMRADQPKEHSNGAR